MRKKIYFFQLNKVDYLTELVKFCAQADEALLGVKKSSCDNVAIGISFPVPLRDNPSFSSIETSHSAVIYHGRLLRDEYEQSNAYFIIIEDSNEVNSLWHQGYYGYAPHKAEFLQPLNNDSEEFNFVKRIRLEADSTNSHCHYLLLSILEACYLMHVFNCLEVKCSTSDKAITLDELWQLVYFNFNFPSLYAAYGYYRSKGWIVKHGLRLGCDLLLYAIGPPFHHAAHCVKVLLQQSNQLKTLSGNCFIMKDLLTVSRVAHGVSKNLLLCTVKWTDNAPTNAIDCVQSMQIVDCSINRFVPKQSSSNADEI